MLYVVTAKRNYYEERCAEWSGSLSRRAVATLDEARQLCYDAMHADERCVGMTRAEITLKIGRLTDSGGKIGPLPDGAEIEVEPVSPLTLAARTPSFSSEALMTCVGLNDYTPLVAAYNAMVGS
jgi:hypothetical protein